MQIAHVVYLEVDIMEQSLLTLAETARPDWHALPGDRPLNLSAADVAERVADLLPSLDVESFDQACETFAALLNAQDTAYWRANTDAARAAGLLTSDRPDVAAFAGRQGGGIEVRDIAGSVPDAWRGEHTVKRGRSKRGATSVVLRRGVAPVIGATDRDVSGMPLLAAPTHDLESSVPACVAARMLSGYAGGPHMLRHGVSSLDVTRTTVTSFGHELPALIGTDAESWSQIIPGDRSSRCAVSRHVGDLSGGESAALASATADASVHASQTSRLRWTPRLVIRTGTLRRGESREMVTGTRTLHGVVSDTPDWQTFTVSSLIAGAADPDHVWHGHALIARPVARKRGQRSKIQRERTARTNARTIGHAETAPATSAGWAELIGNLNRGERVTIGAHVTVTRGKAGKYRATDRRHAATISWEYRTVDALAERLADA